jgi:outer membrane protein assembly factor BamB
MQYLAFFKYSILASLALIVLLALGGCSSWMGDSDDKPPLEGERISILQLEKQLIPDASLSMDDLNIPDAWENDYWPQSGGYPSHVMENLSLTLTVDGDSVNEGWSTSVGSSLDVPFQPSPIVTKDVVYTLNSVGDVTAFNKADGDEVWQVRIAPRFEEKNMFGGGLAFGEGKIFGSAGFNEIMAIDPTNGGLVWRYKTNAAIKTAPTVAAGRVFVTTVNNETLALSAQDGSMLWRHSGLVEGSAIVGGASPAANGDLVIVPYSSGELVALRAATGLVLWSEKLTPIGAQISNLAQLVDIQANPVLDDQVVFASNFSNLTVAIDVRSGNRLWSVPVGSAHTPWVAGDVLYLVAQDGYVMAIDKKSGNIFWRQELDRFEDPEDKTGKIIWKGPVMGADQLILVNNIGELMILNPKDGGVIGRYDLDETIKTPPVIAGKTLYLLTENGYLRTYR